MTNNHFVNKSSNTCCFFCWDWGCLYPFREVVGKRDTIPIPTLRLMPTLFQVSETEIWSRLVELALSELTNFTLLHLQSMDKVNVNISITKTQAWRPKHNTKLSIFICTYPCIKYPEWCPSNSSGRWPSLLFCLSQSVTLRLDHHDKPLRSALFWYPSLLVVLYLFLCSGEFVH